MVRVRIIVKVSFGFRLRLAVCITNSGSVVHTLAVCIALFYFVYGSSIPDRVS